MLLLPLVYCISGCSSDSNIKAEFLKSSYGKIQIPHKVYAHYLCCFDDRCTSESNPYWWATTCDPWDQSQTSGAVLLSDSNAVDKQLQGMIDDIRIAKSYGIDGFFVEFMGDTPNFRAVWTKLLVAAEIKPL